MSDISIRDSAVEAFDSGIINSWDIAAAINYVADVPEKTAKRIHDRLWSQYFKHGRAPEGADTIRTEAGREWYNQYSGRTPLEALYSSDESLVQDDIIYDVDTPHPTMQLEDQVTNLKRINKNLYAELGNVKHKHADVREAIIQAIEDSVFALGPIGPTPPPMRNVESKTHMPEVALWHMTDWQGGKLTTSYNHDVMRERALRFCEKAVKITNIQRADHPIDECVILFGGDMIEGLFQFPTQVFEVDGTLFEQTVWVTELIIEVVQFALAAYDKVTVIGEWGNHGRIGSKRDAVPRHDNFDRMCYDGARRMLRNEPRLTWEDCPEDVQRLEIGAYRALLIHGDEVGRSGFASLNTIVQHVNRWKSGAYNWDFRDVYVGHYHVHYEMPMANGLGHVFGSGSLESDNRYAREMLASSAVPTQRLHFIDPERGRVSAQYKVYVDRD